MAGFVPAPLESYSLRQRLRTHVHSGAFGPEVLQDLLPEGSPHWFEKSLWDYKLELPKASTGVKLSDSEKQKIDVEYSRIVKDAVAFYNTYGGYLIVGVRDTPRVVEGFDTYFDISELITRARAATKHEIDCHYASHDLDINGSTKRVGVLFVPQRPMGKEPAQFLRDAPADSEGRLAYRKRCIYFRSGDQSRAAETAADFHFLCSPDRCNEFAYGVETHRPALTNNLGRREPGFVEFIGRENYLQQLWKWLCDPYSPAKLLSGQGGVGKTTLAREFAQDVIRSGPMGLEFVIWLSAKECVYLAAERKYEQLTVDFNDTQSLLRRLLIELGHPPHTIDPECTKEELIQDMIDTLAIMPSILFIDDVDSLDPDQQQEVFHAIIQITDRTIAKATVPSRALLTARLTLGAASGQLLQIKGLEPDDFWKYILVTAKSMSLPWNVGQQSKLMKKFHDVTDGSPMFASSILSLVKLGHTLEKALDTWKGHDGEEVRAAAFQRELDRLSDSQIRTLYAALVLGETTFVELQTVLDSGETLLSNNIGELHKYHLLAVGNDVPNSGTRLVVPNSLQVMQDIIRKRVPNSRKLDKEASKLRRGNQKTQSLAPRLARTVIALSSQGNHPKALDTILWADKQHKDDADIKCILGSTYLKIQPPNATQADIELRRAYELGCKRTELTKLWAQAKELLEDWVGLLDITHLPNREFPFVEDLLLRSRAYLNLSDLTSKRLQMDIAAEHCLAGAREIDEAFASGRVPRGELRATEWRNVLLENYVRIKDKTYPNRGDHLYVWEACVDAFHSQLRDPVFIELGITRLKSWWSAVEDRPSFQFEGKKKLRYQLERARYILSWFRKAGVQYSSTVEMLQTGIGDLELRSSEYI
jgi:hypothetical protein